ncbi:MAG: hypothetical protein LBG19_05595 [Prevotellaceae bacterium]|nr:hypothetical protein [Prevotellaceae bacterium]
MPSAAGTQYSIWGFVLSATVFRHIFGYIDACPFLVLAYQLPVSVPFSAVEEQRQSKKCKDDNQRTRNNKDSTQIKSAPCLLDCKLPFAQPVVRIP